MKNIDQVLHHIILKGAHSYFSGGDQWGAFNRYFEAVEFIYDIDRDVFYDDFKTLWDGLMNHAIANEMKADDVINYINNNAIYGSYWGPKLR